MRPFRKHVAIAIDGGGIRGIIVTKALEAVESALGKKLGQVFELAAGTSSGSIIATAIAMNLSAAEMTSLYKDQSPKIFKRSLRSLLWPLFPYRYSNDELKRQLDRYTQEKKMGDLWTDARKFDLVIVARDLHEARTRFFKSWKPEYKDLPITTAVLASSASPTFFPVIQGRFVDGGVGSFGNPCFIAAYEASRVLEWKPEETTLISLGTGRLPHDQVGLPLCAPDRFISFQWIVPLIDAFLSDANAQQARVVDQFFPGLDFRRFQIETEAIALDDTSQIDRLIEYGNRMGEMILNDQTDPDVHIPPVRMHEGSSPQSISLPMR